MTQTSQSVKVNQLLKKIKKISYRELSQEQTKTVQKNLPISMPLDASATERIDSASLVAKQSVMAELTLNTLITLK